MNWGGSAAELAKKIAEYHKELVITNVRFAELRHQSSEALSEFKSVVLRIQEQAQARELEHVQQIADLKNQINSLQARLEILSEQALHAAIREIALEKISKSSVDATGRKLRQV